MGNYRTINKEEFIDIQRRILYEDNHLIIFNKRSGEIVQGDKTQDEPLSETLKAFIAQRDAKPGNVFLGVTHRLDRPVSGAVIFCKTSKSLAKVNDMLLNRQIHKTYWALVCSAPPKEEDELIDYLYRNEKSNKTFVSSVAKKNYKKAHLKYSLIKKTDRYYLLKIELYTGRHHQIRAQLANIGCVIKGDLKYGASRSNRDKSISLHARKVDFVHPIKKERVSVEAPLPVEMNRIVS